MTTPPTNQHRVTCPICRQSELRANPAKQELLLCDCGARIAFGVVAPRVTVEPHSDKRFMLWHFDTVAPDGTVTRTSHQLDVGFARAVAENVMGLTRP